MPNLESIDNLKKDIGDIRLKILKTLLILYLSNLQGRQLFV